MLMKYAKHLPPSTSRTTGHEKEDLIQAQEPPKCTIYARAAVTPTIRTIFAISASKSTSTLSRRSPTAKIG